MNDRLGVLRDPNLAYAALVAGLLIACIEFVRPGWILPGAFGGVLAMLGIAALHQHRIEMWAASLMFVACLCAVAEARWRFGGVLVVCAAILLPAGARFLIVGPRIRWWVAIALSVPLTIVLWRLLTIAFAARQSKSVAKSLAKSLGAF